MPPASVQQLVVTNIIPGIVSSILAVMLVETYLYIRRQSGSRRIRNVVGFNGKPCAVIAPAFLVDISGTQPGPDEEIGRVRVVRDRDVYAISRALELCRTVGSAPRLISAKSQDKDLPDNIVCIASWSGNDYTDSFLRRFCSGFVIHNRNLEHSDFDEIYYTSGQYTFKDNESVAYGFIARLTPKLTGLSGTICWYLDIMASPTWLA